MPDITTISIFVIAALSLNITPGPDMLYVIARSVGQSRMAGLVSALGIGGGILVHTLAVAFGLSALLMSVPVAFEVVKYAGALYLIYLGIKTLLNREPLVTGAGVRQVSLWQVFRQGVLTNVLNPKVALFFLAFLPQFVDPARGSTFWQMLLLGLLFDTTSTIVNGAVALLASYAGDLLKGNSTFTRVQRWLTGGIFVALGVRLAFLDRR